MSVYIGPCNCGTDETEIGEPPSQGNPSEIDGDLDMRNDRIVNLRQSGESLSNTVTVGNVSDWVGLLHNAKVDWGGGTMTGDLIMGGNKLREVGDPENDQDVVNKRYFMNILLQNKPYDLGRYIVFPRIDETKTFFTAGKGKGIDLDSDKVFEIFNGNVHCTDIMRPGRLDCRTVSLQKRESNYDIK